MPEAVHVGQRKNIHLNMDQPTLKHTHTKAHKDLIKMNPGNLQMRSKRDHLQPQPQSRSLMAMERRGYSYLLVAVVPGMIWHGVRGTMTTVPAQHAMIVAASLIRVAATISMWLVSGFIFLLNANWAASHLIRTQNPEVQPSSTTHGTTMLTWHIAYRKPDVKPWRLQHSELTDIDSNTLEPLRGRHHDQSTIM